MAHGLPDAADVKLEVPSYAVQDLGELAARLGSPMTYERRGTLVYLDDMSSGLSPYLSAHFGAGSAVDLVTTPADYGGISIRLKTGVGEGNSAGIYKEMPYIDTDKIGLSAYLAIYPQAVTIGIEIIVRTGIVRKSFLVVFNVSAHELYYQDSDANLILFASDVIVTASANFFHYIKLLVNIVSGTYERLVLNQFEYSLAGIDGTVVDDTTEPDIAPFLYVEGDAGNESVAYIDVIIITQGG